MSEQDRRSFLRRAATGLLGIGAPAALFAGGRQRPVAMSPAWPRPIGLELYTVRSQFARQPLPALRAVAAAGYKLVEGDISHMPVPLPELLGYLRQTGLAMVSTLVMQPEPGTAAQWKALMAPAASCHVRYFATMNVRDHDAEGWKRIADDYNRAGKIARQHDMQFCYHNHITEFVPTQGTTGYEILQSQTDPGLVQFEMDVFWMVYAQQDPVAWFRRFPGRFPLLHIKDMKRQVPAAYNPHRFPSGFDPFTEGGRGKIDWQRVFTNVHRAGAKYIYVEQDLTAPLSPLEAVQISYTYLRDLRIG